ncbi:MAG: SBBP repeat-containing protein [Candidatus Kryptonium sp.]
MKRVVIIFISVSLYFVQFLLSQNLVPVNYSNIYGFEPNMGQIGDLKDEKIKEILFFTKHNGIDIFVHSSGVSYVIKSIEKKNDTKKEKLAHFSSFDRFREESKISWAKVDLRFLEAEVKPQNIEYSDPLPGYTNYYLAHCPDGILFVPSYKVVRINNVYPGIDWIWKIGEDGLIHHEFEVEPYASVEKIKFEAKFAQVCLDDNGKSVKFSTPIGEIKDGEVSAWNDLGKVEASYVINDGIEETKIISFDLKNYMPKGKLIIDPPLARVWATYYGGNNADAGYSITVDVNGNVYITGETDGLFPLYNPGEGAYYQGSSSMWEIFILKFNNVGVRQWATYYGGSWYDHGYSIATDANGNVFITGKTQSSNFPLQDSSGGAYYQSTLGGDYDAFILKFNNLGVRQWATYYGGSSEDIGYSIATDPNGNIFVTGATKSTDFPRYDPGGGAYYQDSKGDGGTTYSDIFILKFSNSGQRLWATYYGGNSYEIGYSIATDANGNVFVTGVTNSFSGFSLYDPGGGAYYQTDTNGDDAFILKFNNSGVRLWATRFTGTGAAGGADEARSITIDPNGNVLITGTTTSGNFPIHNPGGGAYVQGGTTNVYSHAFIAKFSNSGQQLWTTCYGGHYREIGHSIATDSRGNIYVVGETHSSDLPTYNPGGNVYFQGNLAGN